jgi:alpha-N-arabinofuranosidase
MARVKIDLDRRLGTIDRKVYGMFIEHLGRCIYGGIYDPGSPRSDAKGFRTDVLEAAQGLQSPILRWPGGNFASGYHWEDGVGPKDRRPVRAELAWNTIETNQFGTNEFIQYCRALNTEPYICANLGSGTMDEAAAWVAYCNRDDLTSYARLRAEHGFPQPHRVTYWGLGNEMYGDWQIAHKSAADYAKLARQCAQVMRATDPSIKLVLCGGQDLDWDRETLGKCADLVDYISYHFYWGTVKGQDAHYSNLAQPYHSEQYLRFLWQLIEQIRRDRGVATSIRIAVDEWNVWDLATTAEGLVEHYDVTDALAVAIYLNMLRRNCQAIGLATLAQMVNVIAPILTSAEGICLQTIYHPLRLAAEKAGGVALDAHVLCDSYEAAYVGVPRVPYLDVLATLDEARKKLFLSLVNLSKDESQTVAVQVQAGSVRTDGTAHVIAGEAPEVTNTFGSESVVCRPQPLSGLGAEFTYTMPPLAHAVLELDII